MNGKKTQQPTIRSIDVPEFKPPWWCAAMHAQTVTAAWKPSGGPRGEPVRIPLEDGRGTLGARWHRQPERAAALVVFMHGVGGSADEGFCVRGAWGALARGFDALRVSMRGCGDSLDPAYPALVHPGLATDVRAVTAWALERYARVHLVGFSMGGHNILRAGIEWGARVPSGVASLVSVSAPLDLPASGNYSDGPNAWPYRWPFIRDMWSRHEAAIDRGAPGPRVPLSRLQTVRDWNEQIIAPTLGFSTVEDLYRALDVAPHLDTVRVPTLVVQADDDPIVDGASIRRLATSRYDTVRFAFSDRGGHCGFFGARPSAHDTTRWWADERALAWVLAHDPDGGGRLLSHRRPRDRSTSGAQAA